MIRGMRFKRRKYILQDLQFIKDYKCNKQWRESFFNLAKSTFGISFENWYEKGFWGRSYVPYSYVDNNEVVANVSINIIDLIIENKKYPALQIGTVMTHPDYRNQGLSKRLLNQILKEYEDKCEIIYLFANESVMDFYPKFGFEIVKEHQYSVVLSSDIESNIRRLDPEKGEDLTFINKFAKERIPVSQRFATGGSEGILMYYCLNVFRDNIYYHEAEDAIVIFSTEDNHIDIFDVISDHEVDIHTILADISGNGPSRIVFHYTPDYEGIKVEINHLERNGALFVKMREGITFPDCIKHPITSEA